MLGIADNRWGAVDLLDWDGIARVGVRDLRWCRVCNCDTWQRCSEVHPPSPDGVQATVVKWECTDPEHNENKEANAAAKKQGRDLRSEPEPKPKASVESKPRKVTRRRRRKKATDK